MYDDIIVIISLSHFLFVMYIYMSTDFVSSRCLHGIIIVSIQNTMHQHYNPLMQFCSPTFTDALLVPPPTKTGFPSTPSRLPWSRTSAIPRGTRDCDRHFTSPPYRQIVLLYSPLAKHHRKATTTLPC